MRVVFADAFYFIALLNQDDQHHSWAVDIASDLRFRFVTTHWILLEVADALSSPAARTRSTRFVREAFHNHAIEVVSEPLAWFEVGLNLFSSRKDKSWSLTDCISFSVMQARGIREALTGDRHFEQAGFIRLLGK